MLTDKERQFIAYWEKSRIGESSFKSKLLRGLPMSLLFAMPIVMLLLTVRIFIPDWYMKISKTSPGMFATVTFAVLVIACFFSFFRMHYKWEMNEQLFKELTSKKQKAQQDSINKTM